MRLWILSLLFVLAQCAGAGPGNYTFADETAHKALEDLPSVSVLAPGYNRDAFGPAWKDIDHNGCDTRSDVMRRDIQIVRTKEGTHGCVVQTGDFYNPYTGKSWRYERAPDSGIEADHVVSLDDGWETGLNAQPQLREQFANDPLNLLITDRASNRTKSAKNAAEWLVPDNPGYRCYFVARQVTVKKKYHLGVTDAERAAMLRVLDKCKDQNLYTEAEVAPPRPFPIREPRR